MSKAIVEVSELKSSLHQHVLTDDEASNAIFKVETLFPYITLSHFAMKKMLIVYMNFYMTMYMITIRHI